MLNTLIAMNGYNGTILWQRPLDPDFMIHRNTMIATPDTLYLADAESCKLFDAATGELRDEIKVPQGISDGPVWKWMALEDDVLYALVGEEEPPGDALKGPAYRGAGWPWWEIPNYAWGLGRTIMALDIKDKRVLWSHRESEPLDTRAMCMKNGRIVFFSHEKFLGCLNAETGETLWKTDDQEILSAIGQRRPAQRAVWGFASSAFAKCNEEAIYFAGPQQERLVAVSAQDGKLLWQYREEGNFQLVLRDDSLFAMGSSHPSRKLDLLSGEILHQLPNRAACTRATGTIDRIFVRGRGTKCWDVAEDKWLHISPMRPACHDGVVVANGHLYWGPWMCGCNLSLVGVICLGPAGDFNHTAHAAQTERLESLAESPVEVAPLEPAAGDWPTYRRDSKRSTCVEQTVSEKAVKQWEFTPPTPNIATAPIAVGDYVFVSGSDGVVRALNAADGESKWTAYTGGAIRVPPSIADGRAFLGSADGWIYAFEAANGRPLWRFRAAPAERKIPVYGTLSSTWPVGAGVLAENGKVYAAAGIANYDGTHVYALDAETGKLVWQNNTSGNTTGGQGAGVSVQGDLLADNGKLYLAGGNAIALASYNLGDGAFSRAPAAKALTDRRGPRGHDLFLKQDGTVSVSGSLPLYIRQEDVHFIDFAELTCPVGTVTVIPQALGLVIPNANDPAKPTSVWAARPFNENVAAVVAGNAVVVAGTNRQLANDQEAAKEAYGITALNIRDGKPIWRHSLHAGPVRWGVAIDRDGRVLVSLRSGQVICFGPEG
jgi:outer membrane protein assembly factor BamB